MFKKIATVRWDDLDLDVIQTSFGFTCRYGLEVMPRRDTLMEALVDFQNCLRHGTECNGEPGA